MLELLNKGFKGLYGMVKPIPPLIGAGKLSEIGKGH